MRKRVLSIALLTTIALLYTYSFSTATVARLSRADAHRVIHVDHVRNDEPPPIHGRLCAHCNHNGECVADSCKCEPGWTGRTCGWLDLIPGTARPLLHKDSRDGVTTWGGSVIRGNEGAWHLFVSRMVNGCGILTWSTNSEIVRCSSRSLFEVPFRCHEVVLGAFAHNPHIVRLPGTRSEATAKYALFHIGAGDGTAIPVPSQNCANGTSLRGLRGAKSSSKRALPGQVPSGDYWIGLATAERPEGPWLEHGPILSASQGVLRDAITNPTAFILPNGTTYLFYRTTHRGRGATQRRVGLAVAPHWLGPYERVPPDALFPDYVEDPFVWRQGSSVHLLLHAAAPADYANPAAQAGKHAFAGSPNGPWSVANVYPYNSTVREINGFRAYARRERPSLVLSSEGRPLALITATSETPWTRNDHGFTMIQQIRS